MPFHTRTRVHDELPIFDLPLKCNDCRDKNVRAGLDVKINIYELRVEITFIFIVTMIGINNILTIPFFRNTYPTIFYI